MYRRRKASIGLGGALRLRLKGTSYTPRELMQQVYLLLLLDPSTSCRMIYYSSRDDIFGRELLLYAILYRRTSSFLSFQYFSRYPSPGMDGIFYWSLFSSLSFWFLARWCRKYPPSSLSGIEYIYPRKCIDSAHFVFTAPSCLCSWFLTLSSFRYFSPRCSDSSRSRGYHCDEVSCPFSPPCPWKASRKRWPSDQAQATAVARWWTGRKKKRLLMLTSRRLSQKRNKKVTRKFRIHCR